jgi:2-keto-4-pentenoate hydratase
MLVGEGLPVRRLGTSRLSPALAVVMATDAPAGSAPEAIYLAVGGTFLALEARGGDRSDALVVSERLLPLPLEGELRLYLGGRLMLETPLEELGQPTERLAWLANQVGGLRAGELVVLGGTAAQEARRGTVEVWGPLGSTLTTTLSEDGS